MTYYYINSMSNIKRKDTVKGDGIFDYYNTVRYGRNDYPPYVRDLISKYGNNIIKTITIDRTPLSKTTYGLLNVVSFGQIQRKMKNQPYDKLYHLRIIILLDNNIRLGLEKNEVINMVLNPKIAKNAELKQVQQIPDNLKLDDLLKGGQKILGDKYFKYNGYDNNCQDFIVALFKGSNIGNEQDINFIKQDTKVLFENNKSVVNAMKKVTDIGAKINDIRYGTGLSKIQSVLFKKPEWTHKKAINWLKKHEFKGLELDEKPEHLRYRQQDPQEMENNGYHFITKPLHKNIEFIIGYQNKQMPRKTLIEGKGHGASTRRRRVDTTLLSLARRLSPMQIRTLLRAYDEIDNLDERQEFLNNLGDLTITELRNELHRQAREYSIMDNERREFIQTVEAEPRPIYVSNGDEREEDYNGPIIHADIEDTTYIPDVEIIRGNTSDIHRPILVASRVRNSGDDSDSDSDTISDSSSDSDSDSDDEDIRQASGTGLDSERKINKMIKQLRKQIKQHHKIHGGKLNIARSFKKLGSTVKRGFMDKFAKPAGKYITAKKGGLASDLLHHGVPLVTGTLAGVAGNVLGGPMGSVVASQIGSRLGKTGADALGKKIGVGLKRRGRPPKAKGSGDLIHIDIDSHNARGKKAINKMEGGSVRHPKGSIEAKEHMAKLRSMRKNK